MFTEDLTRGNEFKLHQGRFRLDIRENFLTVRMVQHQYVLPEGAVGSPSLDIFKSKKS